MVLISGEPGIGKSRLDGSASGAPEGEPHTRLRYFCSPHHQDSALHPFIAQLDAPPGLPATIRSKPSLADCGHCSPRARGMVTI